MVPDPNRELVTIMKAKELAHVSRRTIYNWLESGKIEFVKTAGGSTRIYLDTLFVATNNKRNYPN